MRTQITHWNYTLSIVPIHNDTQENNDGEGNSGPFTIYSITQTTTVTDSFLNKYVIKEFE